MRRVTHIDDPSLSGESEGQNTASRMWGGDAADLHLPAEAFSRLIYGRLDADGSGPPQSFMTMATLPALLLSARP